MSGQRPAYCLEDSLNGMSPNSSGLVAMGRFNSSPEFNRLHKVTVYTNKQKETNHAWIKHD